MPMTAIRVSVSELPSEELAMSDSNSLRHQVCAASACTWVTIIVPQLQSIYVCQVSMLCCDDAGLNDSVLSFQI